MPVSIHLTWTDTGVERTLTHLRGRLADPEPAWVEYGQWLRDEERKQFESEGVYLGHNPWAPLSEKYRQRKERRYPGMKILQATRRLYRSLTQPGGENIEHHVGDTFEFGTAVPYFEYHQRGTSKMPARPPMDDYNHLSAGLGRIWMRHLLGEGADLVGDPSGSSEASEV